MQAIKLYKIKNESAAPEVQLYIKDDGTYILEGLMANVEIGFKEQPSGYKGHIIDGIALDMMIFEYVA